MKKAFNSATWISIVRTLRRLDSTPYLNNIFKSYLSEQNVITEAVKGTVEFADDLALLVTAKTERGLMEMENEATAINCPWMMKISLQIALAKTEADVFSGRCKCQPICLFVAGKGNTTQ